MKKTVSTAMTECRKQLCQNPGSVLREQIKDDEVDALWDQYRPNSRKRVFTPLLTLWTFLAQVLNADKTLEGAVTRAMASIKASGKKAASHDPSGYCKARYRLPIELLITLAHKTADILEQKACKPYLWHDRHVLLVDGSSVSMDDSPANRKTYPQPPTQKKGCGFPVARIVGLFSLTTGALVDLAIGSMANAELALWQLLWKRLKPGDVVLADRLFGRYTDLCLLSARGIDLVARIDKTRKTDFRRGKRLGPNDHLVTWTKPKEKYSNRLSAAEWAKLPSEITLREVRYTLRTRGFRNKHIVLVTTLLDHELYTAKDLARLYGRRWEVETDFKHLKTSMAMDILHGRKPDMIQRELWTFMLAYNLVRTMMWQAAKQRHLNPLDISLAGAAHELLAVWPYTTLMTQEMLPAAYEQLLFLIGSHKIPHRPGRHEPRVQKRRHKDFDYMTRPRKSHRAEAVIVA